MRFRAACWTWPILAKSRSTFSPVDADVINTGAYLRKKILERVSSINSLADCFSRASRLNQVPFVQDDDGWFSRLLNQSGDPFVLGRYAHRQIDDENTNISAANAAFGTHYAENLSRAGNFPSAADSGSVDENELQAVAFVHYVDGVACCAGQLAYNRAFAAHDGVDKRRFTYIRPTDDRDRDWMLNRSIRLRRGYGGQVLDDRCQQARGVAVRLRPVILKSHDHVLR